jgi:hypothetical protein
MLSRWRVRRVPPLRSRRCGRRHDRASRGPIDVAPAPERRHARSAVCPGSQGEGRGRRPPKKPTTRRSSQAAPRTARSMASAIVSTDGAWVHGGLVPYPGSAASSVRRSRQASATGRKISRGAGVPWRKRTDGPSPRDSRVTRGASENEVTGDSDTRSGARWSGLRRRTIGPTSGTIEAERNGLTSPISIVPLVGQVSRGARPLHQTSERVSPDVARAPPGFQKSSGRRARTVRTFDRRSTVAHPFAT